ncbi:hypothetical protein CMT41_18245 [Colwellia sp. MT41]|uniref:exosortase A n=1 Tax=Colwellia sp. MT41 TaxID=58049 RepID=UPI000717984E|nr:exosortase A [Colwellia sp. MT41]ALO36466.1 hypothetical protein CMT41_18245 [Colwellia sp. MT41]
MKITDNRFLVIFTLLILAWALVYQDALMGMEVIWSRSDTFAHGYFILPISLWLLWQDKENLLKSTVQASWLPLPLLAVSLFVGLFAYAADINVLSQLSAVTSLIFLVWALVGNQLAWRYKFPLAYLLFAVPMGENLIPWLQDVTAWFTVFFLKLNGIPVYVDGLYIQIPTGMFEVAVACSGIRYLIASAAVGALYGYLTYQKIYKQIIFFAFALTLPILANGLRAYGIVAIAYYSDMEYATGVDHLIYGWLFFGLVIMFMFWIGGFFADHEKSDSKNSIVIIQDESSNFTWRKVSTPIIALAMIIGTAFVFNSINVIPRPDIPTNALVEKMNFNKINASNWGITFKDGLQRSHLINNQGVEVFKAVYGNKQTQGEMISFENNLHNHKAWTVIETKQKLINNSKVEIVHLRNINGLSRSYIYQYKAGDYIEISTAKIKIAQAFNSLFQLIDTSEIIVVSVSDNSDLLQVEADLLDAFTKLKVLEK